MIKWMLGGLFGLGMAGLFGCAAKPLDRFTLEVDLPPEFELKTAANYRPAPGETCTLPRRRGNRPERKVFFTDYKPVASRVSHELPLSETVEGCPLVLSDLEFDFNAKWGVRSTDVGGDIGRIFIGDDLAAIRTGMPEMGVQELHAQCQWLFRTAGPKQAIIKILKCNALDVAGQPLKMRAGGVALRHQLLGRTLRMVLAIRDEEQPFFDDRWVAVPGGWRRCKGKSFEDLFAYCGSNTTDFKPVKMPDGRICDVYPTCSDKE